MRDVALPGSRGDQRWAPSVSWGERLTFAAVVAWGVFAGTRVLNVPLMYWWRSLEPSEVTAFFAENADRFNHLLFPLGAITGVLSVLAFLTAWPVGDASDRRRFHLGVAVLCFGIVFALNPLFYDKANSELQTVGLLSDAEVLVTLDHWIGAQWVRTVVSLVGLVASIAGLVATTGERRVRERAMLGA